MKAIVCKTTDLQPGELQRAMLGKTPIVICRTYDGEFHAFANKCPHQGAPLAEGMTCGATMPTDIPGEYTYGRDGEILRCPWHGREFDIKGNGRMLADPKRRLPSFHVEVEEDDVVVSR